jgi:hypothetical protein
LAHLDPARAAFYHPMGLLLFPLTVLLASLLVTPEPPRRRLAEWIESQRRPLRYVGIGLLVVFVVYGFGRMAWLLLTHRPSPW